MDARGPFTSRRWRPALHVAQHLLVDVRLPDGAHSRPLVEPARARLGPPVSTPSPTRRSPRSQNQVKACRSSARPRPRRRHAGRTASAFTNPISNCPAVVERNAAHLAALARDRPQRRVEARVPRASASASRRSLLGESSTHGRTPRACTRGPPPDPPRAETAPTTTPAGHAGAGGGSDMSICIRRKCRTGAIAAALEQVAGGPVHVQHGVLDDDTRQGEGLQALLGPRLREPLRASSSTPRPEPVGRARIHRRRRCPRRRPGLSHSRRSCPHPR